MLIIRDARAHRQRQVLAANEKVQSAIEAAESWLDSSNMSSLSQVEERLAAAKAEKLATNRDSIAPIQVRVAERREKLRIANEAAKLQAGAQKLLVDARQLISSGQFPKSQILLQEYVSNPEAQEVQIGKQLLAEIALCNSEAEAIKTLFGLSDEAFSQFTQVKLLNDSRIQTPILSETWRNTLLRALPFVEEQRKVRQAAESNPLRIEQDRLSALAEAKQLPSEANATLNDQRKSREQQGRSDFDRRKSEFARLAIKDEVERLAFNQLPAGELKMAYKRLDGHLALLRLGELWLTDNLTSREILATVNGPSKLTNPKTEITWTRREAIEVFVRDRGLLECNGTGFSCKWIWEESLQRLEEEKANDMPQIDPLAAKVQEEDRIQKLAQLVRNKRDSDLVELRKSLIAITGEIREIDAKAEKLRQLNQLGLRVGVRHMGGSTTIVGNREYTLKDSLAREALESQEADMAKKIARWERGDVTPVDLKMAEPNEFEWRQWKVVFRREIVPEGRYRRWSIDTSGRAVTAEFDSYQNGIVTLKTEDESAIQVSIRELSQADQELVRKEIAKNKAKK